MSELYKTYCLNGNRRVADVFLEILTYIRSQIRHLIEKSDYDRFFLTKNVFE